MSSPSTVLTGVGFITTTAIGAGVFVLPVVFSGLSLTTALLVMAAYCGVMTLAALVMVEIALRFPKGANIHAIAEQALHKRYATLSGLAFTLVFTTVIYSHFCGFDQLFEQLYHHQHHSLALLMVAITAGSLLALISGRLATISGFASALWLPLLLVALYSLGRQLEHPPTFGPTSPVHPIAPQWLLILPVCQACFSFHAILPSLAKRCDFNRNVVLQAVCISMPIIWLVYASWLVVVRSSMSESMINHIASSSESTVHLVMMLSKLLPSPFAEVMLLLFFIAILTSLQGLTLAASDFVKHRLRLKDNSLGNLQATAIIFALPLLMQLGNSDGFIYGMKLSVYGSSFIAVILPCLVAYRSRHRFAGDFRFGSDKMLVALMLFGGSAIVLNMVQHWHY